MNESFYERLKQGLKPVGEEFGVRAISVAAASIPLSLRLKGQLSEFKQSVLAGDRNITTIQPTRRVGWDIIINSNPKTNKKRLDSRFLKVIKGRIEL